MDTVYIKKMVEDNYEFLVGARKHFHKYPELSSCEQETSAYIKKYLEEWGIPYETAGFSSIVAVIRGNQPGKTLAMRGDIDALPITEATGVDYVSVNEGVMHACGHDCHAAFMLGAAKILNELRPEIRGTVKIIFQEAEEIGAGAKRVLAANLLNDVDNIVGLHVSQELDLGVFSTNYGTMSAHGSGVTITIETEGGELSAPEKSKNALLIAADLITTITSHTTQSIPGANQAVLVPTVVKTLETKGGVPSKVELILNFRTLDLEDAVRLDQLSDQAAVGLELAYGARIKVEHREPTTSLNNEVTSTDRAVAVIRRLYGDQAVKFGKPSMGGEDFSRYQIKIPGTYLHVGGAVDGNYRPGHTDKTLVDERVLAFGVEFLLNYAFTYLEE